MDIINLSFGGVYMSVYMYKFSVKGHWQRKFLSRNLEVLTHLRINIILISCQTLLFKSYSHINAPKF